MKKKKLREQSERKEAKFERNRHAVGWVGGLEGGVSRGDRR